MTLVQKVHDLQHNNLHSKSEYLTNKSLSSQPGLLYYTFLYTVIIIHMMNKPCIVLCIYTWRNISIYYRTQIAIKPIRLHRYSPSSQVTDIPLTV